MSQMAYTSFCELWWDTMPLSVLMGPQLDIDEAMHYISENPVLDENFVRTHPNFCWDAYALFRNPSLHQGVQMLYTQPTVCLPISVSFMQASTNVPWDFGRLSSNLYITWEHVKAFPNAPWDYEALLKNPMPVWKEAWESQNRTQVRTRDIHEELVVVTGQTGYYFRCCKSKEELEQDDELTEKDLDDFRIRYPVSFRSPWN